MDLGGHVAKLAVAFHVMRDDDLIAVLRGAVAVETDEVRWRRIAVEAEAVAFGAAAQIGPRELNPFAACPAGHVEDVVVEKEGGHYATSFITELSSAR